MRNISLILGLSIISIILILSPKASAEKVDADMFASVVVNTVFTSTLDNSNINFGYVEPGKTVELKEDTYYNKVTCASNKGSTWYLKISILGEIAGPSPNIALESFKWKVSGSTGDGSYKGDWQPFTKEAQISYTSGVRDSVGGRTEVRFKYKLDLPGNAAGGNYSVKVMYTMTDVP